MMRASLDHDPVAAFVEGGFSAAASGNFRSWTAISSTTRERIESLVEDLLVLLDALDGDPDLEPTMGLVPEGYQDEEEGGDPDAEEDDTGIADYDGLDEQS